MTMTMMTTIIKAQDTIVPKHSQTYKFLGNSNRNFTEAFQA